MVLKGVASKGFARHSLIIEWGATQSIPANQSSITARVYLKSNDQYGAMYASAPNSGSVTVNGVTKNFTANSNLSANQKKLLTTQTFTIGHNSDGTKSFNFSTTYNINVTFNGVFYGNQTASGSGVLDTIPRASSLKMSTATATLGITDVTFTINRSSISFKHDVYWSWNKDKFEEGKWAYITNGSQTTGTSLVSKIPLAPFPSLMPSSKSTFIYIYLDTFSGTNRIGHNIYQLTINLPEDVKPTVGTLSTEELVTKTKTVLETSGTSVRDFVQSHSQVKIGVYSVTPGTGSSIASYEYYTKVGTNKEERWGQNTTGWFTYDFQQYGYYYGQVELIAYTYDARGRYSRTSIMVTVHPYSRPKIRLTSALRVGTTQTTVKFVYVGSITSIKIGSVEKNKATTQIQTIESYKDSSDSTNWWKSVAYNTLSQSVDIANFDVSQSYLIWVGIYDSFGSGEIYGTVSTAYTIMDWHKDKGIGFGKLHEIGDIDVAKTIYLDGNKISINNKLLRLNDEDIVGYGQNSNGQFIWFNDGSMICWKDYVETSSSCNMPYGSVFSTSNQVWTYPSQFTNYPAVSVHVVGGLSYAWGAHGAGGITRYEAPWIIYSPVSSIAKPQGSLIAIGRWK